MSKRQLLCILGVWVMIFLFIGLPSLWRQVLGVASGLLIVVISYNLPHEKKTGPFIENNTPHSNI